VGDGAGGAAAAATCIVAPAGIQPGGGIDTVGFFLVAATVVAVTLLAAFVPARRAARINPTDALRCE